MLSKLNQSIEMWYPSSHGIPYIKYHLKRCGYKVLDARYTMIDDQEWIIAKVRALTFLEKLIKQLRS
jgi:hypothetical protein